MDAGRALEVSLEVRRAATAYSVPEGLLAAVVLAETGGRVVVARGRGKGRRGCDVGIAQIHVPDCDEKRVKSLLYVRKNLFQAARILHLGRGVCERHPGLWYCKRGWWWARYNPGSRRWARRVWKTWQDIRRVADDRS
jgi:hypothetical protein